MGLDIYIHSRGYAEASALEEKLWEDWTEGEPEPKVEYPTDPAKGPSKLHPKNICTPTYLRSSYNSAGFNSIVPKFLKDEDTTLYDIFQPLIGDDSEGYAFEVTDPGKVMLVQDRARDVARRLRALDAPLTTMSLDKFLKPDMTDVQAIEWVEKNLDKAEKAVNEFDKWAFTSKEGYFDPKGLTIHGVTFGPGGEVILVYRAVDSDGQPWSKSYADSAEIIAEEFCQTLLDLIESEGGATLLWSG